ncbi:putative lipoprotein releasing system, ATP-binding protein [Gardnerella vaginalis]|uniref:Putative lipoprotein releasing system, ATP-binding protein n=2 Tax=Gardnerella vaginalis TaxID=2702 RepID=A0A133NN64_GARVA|nr:putative lipoprotein releasing system, ATP-binding protein [Gardnerella vaginalis]
MANKVANKVASKMANKVVSNYLGDLGDLVVNLKNVTREFKRKNRKFIAVDNVDFSLKSGDFVAIVGKSGNGKSTLLNMIAGLLKPTRGSVTIFGCNISLPSISDEQISAIRAKNIGFVTQSQTLLANLNVLNNVILPVRIAQASSVSASSASSLDASLTSFAMDLLKRLNVDDLAHCYPRELSGGEMRRVMIARALINKPRLLILDEPTGDLDSQNTSIVLDLLRESALGGAAVLVVTHDESVAASADFVYTMDSGVLRARFD